MNRRLLVPLALLLATPVFAQPTPADPPARLVEFGEVDEVVGELQHPGGDLTEGRVDEALPSLIRVRVSFEPELLRSAEDI
ncbi:MAG: hypothetical protein R3F60_05820 [bacterium]